MNGAAKEALRQQMLLRALLADARPGVVAGWMRQAPTGARFERGLAAYRANAGALAERTLAAAYPTVQQLLGEESFAALARALWQRHPPQAGDMGLWGLELAAFMADAQSLADEAYLPDVARLEWALHLAERAADAPEDGEVPGLQMLAEHEPQQLRLHLRPGSAVIVSTHPIVTVWQAHRSSEADRFEPVRAAFAAGLGECAWVSRQGWKAVVRAVSPAEAGFVQTLLDGASLEAALQAAEAAADACAAWAPAIEPFHFENWLIRALRDRHLLAVSTLQPA